MGEPCQATSDALDRVNACLDEWEASYGVNPLPAHWGITARIADLRTAAEPLRGAEGQAAEGDGA